MRRANLADRDLLVAWDADPDVRASGGDDDWRDWDSVLAEESGYEEFWLAVEDDGPSGIVVLLDAAREPTHYWGDVEPYTWALDIWIGRPDHRSRGLGTAMLRWAIERCFTVHGARRILIDPLETNVRAIDLYRRVGFTDVGPRTFGEDRCLLLEVSRPDRPRCEPTE